MKKQDKAVSGREKTFIKWLQEVTSIPTAAGKEQFVIAWVKKWVSARKNLEMRADEAGNLFITRRGGTEAGSVRAGGKKIAPLFITAHLDHPAFVVRSVDVKRREAEMEFRGGVNDPYFKGAGVEVYGGAKGRMIGSGKIVELDASAKPFKRVRVKLSQGAGKIRAGDIARWALGAGLRKSVVKKGLLHAPACDDLAAVAAALCALERLRGMTGMEHVGVLLTRAEEIGFIGTLAACTNRSVPRDARLICLENSRSFPESPIGGGPIVRVGDKMSVFGPALTNRLSDILTEHAKTHLEFKWQRKLMPGGTCEATAFSEFGYVSTCVCLALGNYHNMANIDGVGAGKRPAEVGAEFISVSDYLGMIELLVVCAEKLDSAATAPLRVRLEGLLKTHEIVLRE